MEQNNDLMKRMAALNGQPLKNVPPAGGEVDALRKKLRGSRGGANPPAEPVQYRRDLPRTVPAAPRYAPPAGGSARLEEVVTGIERSCAPYGQALVIEQSVADLCAHGAAATASYQQALASQDTRLGARLSDLCDDCPAPEEIVFLDLETTGLSNCPVFLVGIMTFDGGNLTVRQFLARDYSEEAAITHLAAEALRDCRLLVTFNGKTFDLPFLRTRAAACGVPFRADMAHLDLLHEARRLWRRRVPDCKLQTLERYLCGRARSGDIPGSEVPDAYHAFVRTGNAYQIAQILEHNAQDLVTLAELMGVMGSRESRV